MERKELIGTYYDLYDLLGEIETVADALKELTLTTKSRGSIIQNLEHLRLWHLESEMNQLYDMPMHTLKAFRLKWHSAGMQSTLYDFLPKDN